MSTEPDQAGTDPAGTDPASPDPASPDPASTDLAALLADGTKTVLLTQAGTATEARLIRERVAAAGGSDLTAYRLGPPGRPGSMTPPPPGLLDDPAVRLVPLRVAWLPEEHSGRRAARLADLLPGHDPYRPSERRQLRIAARQPARAAVLAGEPATVGELRARWVEATGGTGAGPDGGFAAYVARRATLALDRAEYRLLGPRYKTPSLVKEEILSSRRFRAGLRAVRRTSDSGAAPSLDEAGEILDELAAGWSRRFID